MAATRVVTPEERRARLAMRHHLAPGSESTDPASLAADLLGLHSTDPATVYLAAAVRTAGAPAADLEHALYGERSLVRAHGMRRTLFVHSVDLLPVVQAACAADIAVKERRRIVQLVEEGGIADHGDTWLRKAGQDTLAVLRERGESLGTEVAALVPELGRQLTFGVGKRWAGSQPMSTRVLFLLALEGHIVRTRPRGTWISNIYRWAPMEDWLGGPLTSMPVAEARADLVGRWLRTYGPGTAEDVKWWTGWTMGETRRALAAVDHDEVDLCGATGYVLAGDEEDGDVAGDGPWAALLPALDPTVMGWTDRSWFLGAHRHALFDRSGNAGPTVWWDGRIVGGWSQRTSGEIAVRLLEDVGGEGRSAVESAAHRLEKWLGPVRVTPRFRTPLETELR